MKLLSFSNSDFQLLYFQGGDEVQFRLINDAYNRLISHIDTLEVIEAEAELSNTSVIIEISKHSIPKWLDKLKAYGKPKTTNVANTIFQVGILKPFQKRPFGMAIPLTLTSINHEV